VDIDHEVPVLESDSEVVGCNNLLRWLNNLWWVRSLQGGAAEEHEQSGVVIDGPSGVVCQCLYTSQYATGDFKEGQCNFVWGFGGFRFLGYSQSNSKELKHLL
jgi:hypothetical protein